jgi:hypothetical protein
MWFSFYLGGTDTDSASAIALDSLMNIVLTGATSSSNYPTAGIHTAKSAPLSSFVTRLTPNFNLAVVNSQTFYFDVWHDTGVGTGLNTSSFGNAGDIPISGDWDGTGKKRIGVFRNGTWLLDINNNGAFDAGDKIVTFGQAGDLPVVGDWNGTGRLKLGLYRQGTFILDLSGHLSGVATGLTDATFAFGLATDTPVAADWNHSGATKVGVFRAGQWLLDFSGVHAPTAAYTYGQAGDIPVIGDWDTSGFAKIGVYRNGIWILDYDGDYGMVLGGTHELYLGFGGAGYFPLVY